MSDEGGKDGLSRRSFLKLGILGGIGVAIGTVIRSGAEAQQAETPTPSPKQAVPKTPNQPQATPLTAPEQKKEVSPKQETTVESKEAESMTQKQIEYYKTNFPDLPQLIKNTLQWKNTVATASQNLNLGVDSPLSETLLAMIFVESQGNPKAKSPLGAIGLCQIKLSSAMEVAKNLKPPIQLSYDDLFEPNTNILLGLAYLKKQFTSFPETSLAVWAYHLGHGNMVKAIVEYLVSDLGQERSEILSKLNQEGSESLVGGNNLNFIKLITSKNVVEKLKDGGAFGDNTQFYVPRVGAAASLFGRKIQHLAFSDGHSAKSIQV